ncbi:MAG TPA: A/G-specific adenine glycosylase [Deltaproteobacteria bacterium]|jgi:A/G-specific adenine glycosylase|nr:A/G-specific adenine glycosylase [Methanoregulaceae archaeon]HPO32538.1 A/G-specific adenine glycosylase [Deltaproteobacteria bacterium]HQO59640.1 A/G-specific adenine glycosylase [Deltaproteobacteria bacterium]HUM20826.1 A/G-specific adenine glycosylase [Deltaproteobacteria bacterium]
MPWRETRDPYRILVSEFMLQQTQVERVLGKYPLFIASFPDFQTISCASLKDVLLHWQGLGYNRRAVNLWKTAQAVVEGFHGDLPETREELIRMPGIGRATAGAILAFAFNRPVVFIETNIRRAFIHHFFQDRKDVRDSEILPLVEATLDYENPRQWYYALMDYGSMLGRLSSNPNRRSAHYTRQAPFHGSDRQVRGRIIRVLLEKGTITRKSIISQLNIEADRMRRILSGLECDGLIVREGNSFRLP